MDKLTSKIVISNIHSIIFVHRVQNINVIELTIVVILPKNEIFIDSSYTAVNVAAVTSPAMSGCGGFRHYFLDETTQYYLSQCEKYQESFL